MGWFLGIGYIAPFKSCVLLKVHVRECASCMKRLMGMNIEQHSANRLHSATDRKGAARRGKKSKCIYILVTVISLIFCGELM